jgi:hypothetical protein
MPLRPVKPSSHHPGVESVQDVKELIGVGLHRRVRLKHASVDHLVEDLTCLGCTICVKFDAVPPCFRTFGNGPERRARTGAWIEDTSGAGEL